MMHLFNEWNFYGQNDKVSVKYYRVRVKIQETHFCEAQAFTNKKDAVLKPSSTLLSCPR